MATDKAGIRSLLLRLLADEPDFSIVHDPHLWSLIKTNAPAQGFGPLAASVARPHVAETAERRWCDEQIARSWSRHLRNLEDLEYTAGILNAEGIGTIPLKGSFLACRHYSHPFLRKSSLDIDLVVRNLDLEPACASLERAGYTLDLPLDQARRYSHHVALRHPSRTRIELHFRLNHGPQGIPVEEVFSRALPCTLPGGTSSWKLEPADELLQLTLHVASHRFESLFHLYELRLIWSAASAESKTAAIQRAVQKGYAGTLALTDIGFRLHWQEPFLPAGTTLPKTWLHWRLTKELYIAHENWLTPGRGLSARLGGRFLDLQVTDRASDVLRWIGLFFRMAWVRFRRREWGATAPTKHAK